MADLRRIAEHCEFGATLKKMLRDRLMHGINDERIREKLLQEKDLTYEKAISIAQEMETASHNLKEMKVSKPDPTPPRSEAVHKVFRKNGRPDTKDVKCHRWAFGNGMPIPRSHVLQMWKKGPPSEGVPE